MKFSVLMAVYHKENPCWLRESLESVINQTVVPDEIVVVKDGKLTKQLDEVILEYSEKYPEMLKVCGYEENKGLGPALNYGVKMCSFDTIARMDTDDVSITDRFEKQISFLKANPDIDLVGSNTIEFTDNIDNVVSKRFMPENSEEIIKYSKTRCPFVHPSVMFRKKAILEAGNYQKVHLCEDYDMWVRLLQKGSKCYNIQENLVFMRVNKDFYKRRGGIKYFKSITSFKRKIYKQRYMTRGQYLKTYWASAIVCLAPGFVRSFIYKKMLRG